MKVQAIAFVSSVLVAVAFGSVAPWEQYIQSPASRDIAPVSIYGSSGNVNVSDLTARLSGNGSTVTNDFGQQVAGFITLQFAPAAPDSTYTFGREFARGSFRYLTLSTSSSAPIEITGVSTHFTAAPATDDDKLREYSGYFYRDDELLNRIWYAGAYTVQICTIASNESRANPPTITKYGWFSNATIQNVTSGAEVYVDGTKRDRTPWPGDFGVATLSWVTTLNDDNLLSVRHAINSLYAIQNTTNGQFAYAGTPIAPRVQLAGINSDTYHLWTLISIVDYAILTADTEFLKSHWDRALFGFEFNLGNVDSSDMLLNVTGVFDWGRVGQGGKNIAASSLLYHALYSYADMAKHLGYEVPSYSGTTFGDLAGAVKTAVNINLWDDSVGLFRDNTTAAGAELHPQDGNSLAVRYNLTQSSEQATTVSENLAARWNEYGAVSPEGLGSISPFITSLEVEAHLRATPGDASHALAIIRRQWGYMLDTFSNSTTIEAYYETGELMYPFYGLELGAYISHAHAWSTGPTASLTLHVGGLSPVTDAGKTWKFVPHAAGAGIGELHTGYSLATGDFSVKWTTKDEDSFFQANFETPKNTTGSISVPTFGKALDTIEIFINGNTVWANGESSWTGFGAAVASSDFVTVSQVPFGGWISIVAKD
ncbi:glycoside hydrolase, putative [Phytophthora infestans T30-4]|uniref:Glycoside hydrolase, putative n=1 Tax=Phytophthora infestans (strain T30-4) TaxID=403677 RepID=D0N3J3_PHYIT|nr:glycoside hydrolase, putative [Phytophthora infestans T30-4]EEY68947.1 glycoside hydrolase, putative [Phytophthora infestans T30-4]|eukprot:XP_002998801.1 glycoside hydrolase, putative [Phytophthora infestans T30-4]